MDVATDAVIGELARQNVPVLRVNTEDYPFSGCIDYQPGSQPRNAFPLSSSNQGFRSIWYRRFRIPAAPVDMDPGLYDFCVRESRSALLGGLLDLPGRWMSRPEAIWKAEFKPYQLDLAARLGIPIPKTLISNVPASIREFFRLCDGNMIAKPVRSGHIRQNGTDCAIFTTKISADDLVELEDASLSPVIYQQLIPKQCDIRVTLVGKKIFAAAIDSQSDEKAAIDWRKTSNPHLPHRATELPIEVQNQVLSLMEALSLEYGAIDLVLTPDGRYIFLEVNPNGQWLWLDDKLSLGISSAIASWLAREDVD